MDSETLDAIREIMRHVTVLNDEYGKIAVSVAILQERVDWLCKFFWLIAMASVGAFATNIWQLVKMTKDKKDN